MNFDILIYFNNLTLKRSGNLCQMSQQMKQLFTNSQLLINIIKDAQSRQEMKINAS